MPPTSGLESWHKTSIGAFCFMGGWETTEKACEVLHLMLQQKKNWKNHFFQTFSPWRNPDFLFFKEKQTSNAEQSRTYTFRWEQPAPRLHYQQSKVREGSQGQQTLPSLHANFPVRCRLWTHSKPPDDKIASVQKRNYPDTMAKPIIKDKKTHILPESYRCDHRTSVCKCPGKSQHQENLYLMTLTWPRYAHDYVKFCLLW